MNLESLSDERLLVTGDNAGEVVLRRFTADGLADNTFGSSGVVTTTFGATDWGYDVGVQPDGKVIVVGASYAGSDIDGLVARYNVDGTLDTTFGTSGKMLIWFGSSSYSESDYFQSVAIQKDGQIVAAGAAAGKFAVARMNGGVSRLYAQQDANYNATAVTDVSGNVKQRMDYTPYGVMTVLSPTWSSTSDGYAWQYTFQGGRYDSATGMIRFGLRDYRAALGTWMEQDPLGPAFVDGADLYDGLESNPSSRVDPHGLAADGDGDVQLTKEDLLNVYMQDISDTKKRLQNLASSIQRECQGQPGASKVLAEIGSALANLNTVTSSLLSLASANKLLGAKNLIAPGARATVSGISNGLTVVGMGVELINLHNAVKNGDKNEIVSSSAVEVGSAVGMFVPVVGAATAAGSIGKVIINGVADHVCETIDKASKAKACAERQIEAQDQLKELKALTEEMKQRGLTGS